MGAKTRKKESVPDKQGLIVRRTAKDSVFCNLFSDKRYLLQLYQALHPEDTETTEDDLTDITIRNVLTDGIYNDVGFRNKDKVIILTEAQSTWSMNILIRMLLYLAETYHDYFRKTNADLYSSKKVSMPNAELYVIFTGKRMNHPKYISLSEEFFHGHQCSVEVKAKVLYGEGYKDIVSQYVEFSKVYTEQVKKHGYTRKAVLETIRICKDQDVLAEYLKTREREVVSIMMALFDEEYIQQAYRNRLIDETTKEVTKEVTEAVTKEMTDKAIEKEKKLAKKLYQKGFSLEDIAEVSEVSVEVVKQWFDS
ncbi:hypothetical protein D3Z55_14955 [Clostridiaceae bacterium]|nr:hypothetical protein [Clostridiaceae bacterium]